MNEETHKFSLNKNVIKKPSVKKKFSFKSAIGLKLSVLALALGIKVGIDNLSLGTLKFVNTEYTSQNSPGSQMRPKVIRGNVTIPIYSNIEGKKVLTTISSDKLVILEDSSESVPESAKLCRISAIGDDNQFISGYVNKNFIDTSIPLSQDSISLYKISATGGIKLRKTPEIADNVFSSIPAGSILLATKSNNANKDWADVIYLNGTSLTRGFASAKFLTKISNSLNVTSIFIHNNSILSPAGNRFGIDVSHINPETLDKLLKGQLQLNKLVKNRYGEDIDISYFNRNISFVYIKAAGTAPLAKGLVKGKPTQVKRLAKVCADNNIPFGFYCYSTCTNSREAKVEYQWFSEILKKFKNNPYNRLPLAIDVEVSGKRDRQLKVPIDKVTSAKIELTNLLEKDFGKTILYIPRNAYNSELDSRIFDLEQYQEGLNSGKSHIWHVAPLRSKKHHQSLVTVADHVTAKQIVLDVSVTKEQQDLIDINLINSQAFNEYLNGKYNSFYAKGNNKRLVSQNRHER